MDLNVQFLSSKYIDYRKGCPGLPPHMGLSIAPVEALPVNLEEADSELDIGMEKEESREIPNVEESLDSLLGSEPNFSDDDSDPPTEYQNCRREDIGRPKSLDRTEKQRKPPDAPVIGEAVASSSCASSITLTLVNAMDVSGRQTQSNSVTLGDTRQVVDSPASVEYTLRKAPVDDDELLPIRYRQLSASSVSVQLEAPVPVSLNRIFETSPRARCRPKSMAFQSKTKVKSTSEASESRDIEGQSSGYNYDGHRKVPSRQVLSPLPNECGAVASEISSISPFSAFLERYSVPEPSSIVKRCLQQKSKAYVPVLTASSVPIRNLSNEGFIENLPRTPQCKPRVVVVIPDDTPILSSKEVIDLTDSPY